jgi:hypothetical protein
MQDSSGEDADPHLLRPPIAIAWAICNILKERLADFL